MRMFLQFHQAESQIKANLNLPSDATLLNNDFTATRVGFPTVVLI